ncbi:3-deoxy-D-manno-octulosonic acid kinase [Motilimonas sp. KMU-193]|uniref:3-deoxy-D-manno-octulosonic acid kinase n=1 Tax=Motilimonas sp. KMU-193 TaxID=3388668 RepID=UPI00396B25CB
MQQRDLANGKIWFNEALLTEDPNACFDIAYWQQQDRVIGSAQGRGTTWFIKGEKTEMALRHYRRGGLFGKLVADSYWFTGWQKTRSLQEFSLLQKLHEQGVKVPAPIAARAIKSGFTYRADILQQKIPHSQDLVGLLSQQTLSENLWHQIGQTIAQMHQAKVNHTDLNCHNILLEQQQQVWLIDFDKCYQQSGKGWQQGNLDRLLRSFNKEVTKRNIHFNQDNWQALLAGYRAK